MKKKILLFGAGGHAKSCIDVIQKNNKFEVVGLIGKKNEIGKKINGFKVLGTETEASYFLNKGIKNALITLGNYNNQYVRDKIFNFLKKKKFIFPKIISPLAYVSKSSKIAEGTIVMHGAIINSNSVVGSNCIINSKSLIEHDCEIKNNVHISTGTIVNGSVKVGSNSFIGSGSVIKNNLIIKPGSFIKMGSILKR